MNPARRTKVAISIWAAFLLCLDCTASEALSPPPPQVMPSEIALDLALDGAKAALEACRKIDERVAVGVVDRAERLRVLLVADGSESRDWLQSVQRQAHTVIKTGMSSGDYGTSLNNDLSKTSAAINVDRDAQISSGHYLPILMQVTPAAVPIMRAGAMVGAVSVSGNNPRRSTGGYEYMGPVEPCATAGRQVIEAGFNH